MTAVRDKHHKPQVALWAGAASLVTVSVLIVIKFFAYYQSGSTSVLASLIDSIMDASVSLMSLFAIRLSLKPADADHRYGHGKVEGLAALFQAAFLTGAGAFLLLESLQRFLTPHEVSGHMSVIIVMAISVVVSIALVLVQKRSLKKAPSLAVEADQAHYSTDIAVNLGVIIVMLALYYGAPAWLDPVFAVAVVIYMAFTVRDIAGKGIDMLLDRELPGDAREIITRKVLSHEGVVGIHDLRTYKSGMRIFISFDIELNGDLTLHEAHEIGREVEHQLLAEFPNADIFIHKDPQGDTDDTRHRVAGVHD